MLASGHSVAYDFLGMSGFETRELAIQATNPSISPSFFPSSKQIFKMAAPVGEVGVDEGGRHSYLGQAEEDAHIFRPRVHK